jgi:hypothetical protein
VLPMLLLAGVFTVITKGHPLFFIFPLLWFMGGFRRRRGW